jgi:hypothetical protein
MTDTATPFPFVVPPQEGATVAAVNELLKQLLPMGSRGAVAGRRSWQQYPVWPPDAFAVAATIVLRSACYTSLARENGPCTQFHDEVYRDRLLRLGRAWRSGVWYTARGALDSIVDDRSLFEVKQADLQALWARLRDETSEVVDVPLATAQAALALMIVADEACAGLGFPARGGAKPATWVQSVYASMEFETPRNEQSRTEPFIEHEPPSTATRFIDTDIVCVQPKARTPAVGCTLRSLTHHLALLPPQGLVRARWSQAPVSAARPTVFNVLVVPYPYRISGRSIVPQQAAAAKDRTWGWFGVKPDWLPRGEGGVSPFAGFIGDLIREAEREVTHVEGVIIPELALDQSTYSILADELGKQRYKNLGILVCGVADSSEGAKKNLAVTRIYYSYPEQKDAHSIRQFQHRKHHRWLLNGSQIRQYSLGDALDPSWNWWEDTEIGRRELNFYVFRPGACFVTLICEDLARSDPCQDVVRAIGPNLVIALLMDGPQLEDRWSARYATVLADDPGSAVLTVTSLGLVARSGHFYGSGSRTVALWKDSTGRMRKLDLPNGAHALILTLTSHRGKEFTLDGRDDGGSASYWTLSGTLPVSHPEPPKWL